MAIGVNTYKGLGVPRYGESEMRQESSLDMLTMTHSTLDGGDFLTLRGNVPEGSTVTGQDVLSITSAGAVVGSEQSTVNNWSISETGAFAGYKRPVTTVSSATNGTTIYQLPTTLSGHLIVVDGGTQGLSVLLPPAVAGLEYTVYQSSDHPATIDVVCSSDDADDIILPGGNSTLMTTAAALAPQSTIAGAMCRFTAINGARWIADVSLNSSGITSAVAEIGGSWIAGTSIAP